MEEENPILIKSKKQYGICASIFCCKCLECCQETDQSLLTSNDRKKTLQQLIINTSRPKASDINNSVKDPIEILIGLYLSNDQENSERFMQNLLKCRINANYTAKTFQRDDIEYYIPQLCSYIAFHQEFKDESLLQYIKQAGQINFYFAHLLYFYLRSLSYIVSKKETTVIKQIDKMQKFLYEFFSSKYENKYLISKELSKDRGRFYSSESSNENGKYMAPNKEEQQIVDEIIQKYGTVESDEVEKNTIRIKSSHITLKNYKRQIVFEDFEMKGERGFTNHQMSLSDTDDQNNGIEKPIQIEQNGFASTINFLDDLITASEKLKNADPKVVALITYIKQINEQLPSTAYIPFFTNSIRTYVALNIVPSECKVFSTKERSPYQVCIEIYSPELEEQYEQDEKLPKNNNLVRRIPDWKREYNQSSAQTVYDYFYSNDNQKSLRLGGYQTERGHSQSVIERIQFQTVNEQQAQHARMTYQGGVFELEDLSEKGVSIDFNKKDSSDLTLGDKAQSGIACAYEQSEDLSRIKEGINGSVLSESQASMNGDQENGLRTEDSLQTPNNNVSGAVSYNHNVPSYIDMGGSSRKSNQDNKEIEIIPNGEKINIKVFAKRLFGEDVADQEKRIKKKSPYAHFKSWKLVHFIVKTGDNLKQEQFAQQLIYQFDQIFKDSGLNLILRPYEIVSLGPNCGILEVVKNSVTIDSLKRKLHELYQKPITLNQFFKLYYGNNLQKAQKNFCSSLAAYSLVCYFLQIKDRHNGNILLHKEGYVCHIDFGFLLSNAPGKGLAFENNVPFKLLTEYIDVLGGFDSDLFKTFRQLFYKGFQAARKNQDKILILVKMLYSAHGTSLPCFEKGEEAIKALEERFNPKNFKMDTECFMHTNQLINQSLDNWKSRWYDKWQYFCQGIFY